jgi:hypothetical protein
MFWKTGFELELFCDYFESFSGLFTELLEGSQLFFLSSDFFGIVVVVIIMIVFFIDICSKKIHFPK